LGGVGQSVALTRVARLIAVRLPPTSARPRARAGASLSYAEGVTIARPLNLGRAWDLAEQYTATLRSAHPDIVHVDAAGAIRRGESLISSISLVVRASDPDAAADAISSALDLANTHRPVRRELTGWDRSAQISIHVAGEEDYGTALFRATGTDAHVAQIERRGALGRPHATEASLYSGAGLPFIAPELRLGQGEIEAAESGRLPRLVERSDMRGDLHMHTVFSDGRDPVAVMIEGCRALGYEYIAITDHSFGSGLARVLDRDSIARQRDEIDRLRSRVPGLTILHGCEVDILPNGSLALEDSVMESFDIILASLHQRSGQDGAQLTARSLAALKHPLVNVLCHPGNQLVGSSAPYPLDYQALYAAAAESGTALEIDGAPSHMDLDGARAREAAAAGVTLTIDSDCHRVEALSRQMGFGVRLARRGWVEPHHVLNTRPLAEVKAFIAAKRAGREPQPG
jgi:DNA polymerase (family X)